MNQSSTPIPANLQSIFSPAALPSAAAGAAGGLGGFLLGEVVSVFTGANSGQLQPLPQLLFGTACWCAVIGLVIGAVTLVHDNIRSLHGKPERDLLVALPLFLILSFMGGIAGQAFYLLAQNSLTRGIGWALMGLGIGAGIGLARRNMVQAGRGAMGGAAGGFLGGLIFDVLTFISSAGDGALSRCVGLVIMGALIALLIRVVQDALRSAWLLGITTGPYEGKEYTLSTQRVTVGRGESNDIALFRLEGLPEHLGALVFQGDNWWWSGQPMGINGVAQTNSIVMPGDTLLIGGTQFRFLGRSVKAPAPVYPPPPPYVPAPPTYTTPMAQVPTAAANWGLMDSAGRATRLPAGNGAMTVGRLGSNDMVLPDAAVSSNHARLNVDSGVLTVTDLGSTNGTFVNGQRLPVQSPAALRSGDRVKFAASEFVVTAG